MRINARLVLMALIASVALAFGSGSAAASRRLEVNMNFLQLLAAALVFTAPEIEVPITCEVLREIRLNRQIEKRVGAEMGAIVAAFTLRACTGGSLTFLGLPWPIQYDGFNGTLPRITGIRIRVVNMAVLIVAAGGLARCLYRGTLGMTLNVNERSEISSSTASEASMVPLATQLAGSLFCPRVGAIRGNLERRLNNVLVRLL